MKNLPLGQVLVEAGFLTPEKLDEALALQKEKGGRLGDLLVENGYVTEHNLMLALQQRLEVPFVDLQTAVELTKGTNIKVGAQNLHFAEKGAYTGEISASMLTEVGAQYVVIGHSERRQYFAETDETVNLKIKAALAAGLTPIVCVGETLEERESGVTEKVVSGQTRAALRELTEGQARACIIAYEPIWAIGTGRTATAAQADEVCGIIRAVAHDNGTGIGQKRSHIADTVAPLQHRRKPLLIRLRAYAPARAFAYR